MLFSRNSASSRAIPISKQLKKVKEEPAFPSMWASEQPGMQAGIELEGFDKDIAQNLFEDIRGYTTQRISGYLEYVSKSFPDPKEVKAHTLHKSLLNRLLEPFMWHTVICSSVEWENFFTQRCSPLAQPEIRLAAEAMWEALNNSNPTELGYGQYHTPYIQEEEEWQLPLLDRIRVSVARCARVSYLTHDGVRDIEKDLELFDRLINADPGHWSPAEHVAKPFSGLTLGNFDGWEQLRHSSLVKQWRNDDN